MMTVGEMADGATASRAPGTWLRSATAARIMPWLAAAMSALLFLIATRHGIGLRPDSLRYAGLSVNPDDAPVYGAILRSLMALGIGVEAAAKVLGLTLIIANAIAIWATIARASARFLAPVLGTALILLAPQFLTMHVNALSEPLFILSILGCAAVYIAYIDGGRPWLLVACGVAVAFATLVRFPGVTLGIPMAVLLLVVPRGRSLSGRFGEVLTIAAVGGAIVLAWALLSQLTAGHSIGREFGFYGNPDAERWMNGLTTLTAFILPAPVPLLARVALLIAALAAVATIWTVYARRFLADSGAEGLDPRRHVAPFFGIFAIAYVAFMVLAIHVEANLPLNGRYGLPFYTAVVIATAASCGWFSAAENRAARFATILLVAIGLVSLAGHAVRTSVKTHEFWRDGISFASLAWQRSPTVAAVEELPEDAVVYSDAADYLIYRTGRDARQLPKRFERRTGLEMPSNPFDAQVAQARRELRAGRTYFVFFDNVDWRFYLASEAELRRLLPIHLIAEFPDGRIYGGPFTPSFDSTTRARPARRTAQSEGEA